MNWLLLQLIVILHIIFVLFVIITPFTNYTPLLFLHAFIVPFVMLHWVMNNNMCSLTLAEKKVREHLYGTTNSNDCFTCRVIEPVYDFAKDNGEYSIFIYTVTTILWTISMYKLYMKVQNGEIAHLEDLGKW